MIGKRRSLSLDLVWKANQTLESHNHCGASEAAPRKTDGRAWPTHALFQLCNALPEGTFGLTNVEVNASLKNGDLVQRAPRWPDHAVWVIQ